eukprot:1642768-Amphidinium_carterae.1
MSPSYHRRPLPSPPAVAFSSEVGRQYFKEALTDGTAEAAFFLLEQYHTQDEPAFCGLGTLVMCLNALGVDPRQKWKGPWRWYTESMLSCCEPLDVVKEKGITFSKFVCLAFCNGVEVEPVRGDDVTDEVLRKAVLDSVRVPHGQALVVAYSRKEFGQTGDGHYSPIAAYHAESDSVL